jgi:sulfur-carrier protein adenylyltransferase/sulfurtransferase
MTEATFSPEEALRYARHFVLPEVGPAGQRKLREAKVLVVGAGGLGAPVALYLAAAGVGTLGLVDFDTVDATNLQRQLLYGTKDVGRPKLEAAEERLRGINPDVHIVPHPVRLTSENAIDIVRGYDVVADGTDNFPTRYLVNDACVLTRTPNVFASVLRWEGQLSVFGLEGGPCYRCLFREPPPPGAVPDCAEGGVLGVLPGILGTLQALETIKLILGAGTTMAGRFLVFDGLALEFRELRLRRDPGCPVCGDAPTQTELIDYEVFCGLAPLEEREEENEMEPSELRARIEGDRAPFLLDVREPHEWEAASLEEHGARLIPLGELGGRLDELPRDREIVVYCLSGARSARAAGELRAAGFLPVSNLRGGIAAWIEEATPSRETR